MINDNHDYKSLDVKKIYLPENYGEKILQSILKYQNNTTLRFRIYDIQHIVMNDGRHNYAWIYYYGIFPDEKEYKS